MKRCVLLLLLLCASPALGQSPVERQGNKDQPGGYIGLGLDGTFPMSANPNPTGIATWPGPTDCVSAKQIFIVTTQATPSDPPVGATFVCPRGPGSAPIQVDSIALDRFVELNDGAVSVQADGATILRAIAESPLAQEVYLGTGAFTNQPSNDAVEFLSSNAGDTTQIVTICGTTSGGSSSTVTCEPDPLSGTTVGTTSKKDWGNILFVKLSTAMAGTLTVRKATGDLTITTLTPGALRAAHQNMLVTRAPAGFSSFFDGAGVGNAKIDVTDQVAIDAQIFTVAIWFRASSRGEGLLGRFADKRQGTSTGWQWYYNANGGIDEIDLDFYTTGTPATYTITNPGYNQWHHLAFSFDATSGSGMNFNLATYKPSIWLDGIAVPAGSVTIGQAPNAAYSPGTQILTIGNTFTQTRAFDGYLSELCYNNRTLVTAEIANMMKYGCLSVAGAIGYWPMGRFTGHNFSSTAGLGGTATGVTLSTTIYPPLLQKGPGL